MRISQKDEEVSFYAQKGAADRIGFEWKKELKKMKTRKGNKKENDNQNNSSVFSLGFSSIFSR